MRPWFERTETQMDRRPASINRSWRAFVVGTLVAAILTTVSLTGWVLGKRYWPVWREQSIAAALAGSRKPPFWWPQCNEVDGCRAKRRPDEHFLEVLRAENPWNFHFSTPKTENVVAADVTQAAMDLFYRHVLRSPRAARKPPSASPWHMELYAVPV